MTKDEIQHLGMLSRINLSDEEVEKFQKTVIDIMGEVDPEVRKEIIRRLHTEHSIKSAIRYS